MTNPTGPSADSAERIAIPLAEETFHVATREVETGRIRVRTVAEERTEQLSEELLHSEVAVRRVPIDREIGHLPTVREEGDTVIVPVIEERLVKRLFLVEEVHLTRQVHRERLERPVQLRTERAIVEREDALPAPAGQAATPRPTDRKD